MRLKKLSHFAIISGFSLFSAALCILLLILQPPFAKRLDEMIYDGFMTLRGKRPVHPGIAIIDIDEDSLAAHGQWPWPRWKMANLVDKLFQDGVVAIGLDILQHERDSTSLSQVSDGLEKNFNVKLDLSNVSENLRDNDLLYKQTIADKPVVLGAFALYGDFKIQDLPPAPGLTEKTPPGAPQPRDTISTADSILAPLPEFYEVAPVGIINASVFSDGVVRKVSMLTRVGDRIYPNLALRVLMSAQNKKVIRLDSDMDGLSELKAGAIKIPVGHDGFFRPVFRGPAYSYPYYSVKDVLDGTVGKKELENKIVFIGSSATGLLDVRSTPFDPVTPGVEIHATVADNMLTGESMTIPAWGNGVQILAICVAAILSGLFFGRFPAIAYAPLAIALAAGSVWGAWIIFQNGIFLSPLYTLSAILFSGAFILAFRFWHEERRRREVKSAFSRYVAPDVVSRIIEQNGRPLAGEQKEVSILFTDIRNFTSISENLQPDLIVKLLNNYFTPMTKCVISNEGTMDKFIGDALMAFWNAPLNVENHQLKSVQAALAMQKTLKTMKDDLLREYGAPIAMGVGINSGIVHVGNMGSADLLSYTCIGDNVNLASRLESLCKKYCAEIVVSESVYQACKDTLYFRHLDRIRVKGKNEPVNIYTPVENADTEYEDVWHSALSAYFQGYFQKALEMFDSLKEKNSCITMFMERCSVFLKNPPDNWEGIWTAKDK